jgi:hypothetical protein
MYAAPVGFDPYAFLNSDGSGGVSNTAGQLVGAAMDLSGGMGRGPETSGATSAVGSGVLIGPGEVSTPGSPANEVFCVRAGTASGQSFIITADVTVVSGGVRVLMPGGTASEAYTTSGSITYIANAVTAPNVFFQAFGATFVGTIRNFRIFQAPAPLANAATQSTTANKPIIAAGPTSLFNGFSFDNTDALATGAMAGTASECVIASVRYRAINPTSSWFNRGTAGLPGSMAGQVNVAGTLTLIVRDAIGFQTVDASNAVSANEILTMSMTKAATRAYVRKNSVELATGAFAGVAQASPTPLTLNVGFAANAQMDLFFVAWLPAEPTAAEFAILERAAGICSGQVTS